MRNEVSNRFDLDVEAFEIARSIHRVVRAMHDGECPQCHTIGPAERMELGNIHGVLVGWRCPSCGWGFDKATADAAMAEFAPIMAKNLAIFETWRAARTEADRFVAPQAL